MGGSWHRLNTDVQLDIETVTSLRQQGNIFRLVDVAMMITGKCRDYAGQQLRFVRDRYQDFREKITMKRFPGRGRETPVGDIYTVVELIMLLPGKRTGLLNLGKAIQDSANLPYKAAGEP